MCVGWLERDLQEESRHWDGNDVLRLRDAKDGYYLYSTYQNAQMYLMAVYKSIPNDNPMRIIQIFADVELIEDRCHVALVAFSAAGEKLLSFSSSGNGELRVFQLEELLRDQLSIADEIPVGIVATKTKEVLPPKIGALYVPRAGADAVGRRYAVRPLRRVRKKTHPGHRLLTARFLPCQYWQNHLKKERAEAGHWRHADSEA